MQQRELLLWKSGWSHKTELEWEAQLRQGGIGRVDDPDGEGGRDEDPNDGALPFRHIAPNLSATS